ncbi:MAG: hypothetical protein FWC71_09180 [Defluviitaleaceae bacterium]|nr:hypothetical protein [Defluviitaleaceae bacterium]
MTASRILRNRRGNAYLFVIVAVLMITLLAGVVLTLTAASRRSSMYYIGFSGLYALAVAGNEQALFDMREFFAASTTNPPTINIEAMPSWQPTTPGVVYRSWQVTVLSESFNGKTTVTYAPLVNPYEARWHVRSVVNRTDAAQFPVAVQADIVPTLDGNSLRMINSTRITY